MSFRIEASYGSEMGKVRANNEDNLFFGGVILPQEHERCAVRSQSLALKQDQAFAVAVFDGMGGGEGGQAASYHAAQIFRACAKNPMGMTSMGRFLQDAVTNMNRDVADLAREANAVVGTTAVLLSILNGKCYVCNVGDSRAYLLRGDVLYLISKDHTDAESLKKRGITGRKPRLTQYIGMPEEELTLLPFLAKGDLRGGDQFLLCSDGLTDMLSPDDIRRTMRTAATSVDCVSSLLRQALEQGGRDNATVIHVRVQE